MTLMRSTIYRAVAAIQLALIAPAALFMTMVIVRAMQPQEHEPAHSAQRIMLWFAGRRWTLDVLLIALPMLVVLLGGATVLRLWRGDANLRQDALGTVAVIRAHFTALLIATTTLVAAGILTIVAVHVLTD